jgi:hypothetical protein
MAVWCRQSVNGEAQPTLRIEPHSPDQTDEELLDAKRRGAREKGWKVASTGPASFTATKRRWADDLCVREFWIE